MSHVIVCMNDEKSSSIMFDMKFGGMLYSHFNPGTGVTGERAFKRAIWFYSCSVVKVVSGQKC